MRTQALIAFALALTAFLAPAGVAAPVIDQEQPVIDTSAGVVYAIGGGSEQMLAQVVTPGLTGFLTEVRFAAACATDLTVEVQGVTSGLPDGTVHGSQTVPFPIPFPPSQPGFRSILFSTPVPVTAGIPYALVLTAPVGCGMSLGPLGNPYPGGDAYFDSRPNPRGVWVPLAGDRFDLPFQTLVDAPQVELVPNELSRDIIEGKVTSASFSVRNNSTRSFDLTLSEAPGDCDTPGDVSWLSLPEDTVNAAPGAATDVAVSLDASGLTAPDSHSATVCVELEGETVLELPVRLQVQYPFSGFLATFAGPPVLNDAHSGGVQTLWFRLGGDRGLGAVTEAFSREIDCATREASGPLEPAETPSWQGLSYQPHTGRYAFPWRTTTTSKGTCRELVLTLADTSVHAAWFRFVK